jgi:Undecaprenyl-phosphate glucose phosphotransferase
VLSAFVIATVAIFGEFRPNDKLVLYPLLFSFISSTLLRLLFLALTKIIIRNGYQQQSVLVIGFGHLAKQVIAKIMSTPELGLQILGILSDRKPDHSLKRFYLGSLKQFPEILRSHPIDQVIVAKPLNEVSEIKRIVQHCEEEGVRFCIVPDFHNIIPKWTLLSRFGNIPVIAARNEPLSIFGNQITKRIFDIFVSFSSLLLLSPIFLVIAVGVRLSSPGPIFFRQKRIGNNNLDFTLYKFRSMIVQPFHESNTSWTLPNDRRVTPFGRILRQTNLDELPQLWNVLIGDMSIVGPRPEREHFVEKFSQEIPNYRMRHLVKSGITGLAQANGWRGNTSIQKRLENDLYYLEHWSLWLDLKIIFLTFFSRAAWKNAI